MRQLKPEIVEQRKRHLLQWIVHYFTKTSKPVSSSLIAAEAGLDLSSATIRSILQELEEEGYLHQTHSSAGREPTDKGYRFFVDFLSDIQRLASEEKMRIEEQYASRRDELDSLLSETSRLLSRVSQGAGVVLTPQIRRQHIQRLELVALGGRNVLIVLVTEAGHVRHWSVTLGFTPTVRQIGLLSRFLNEHVRGLNVVEAQKTVLEKLEHMQSEFSGLTRLASDLLSSVGTVASSEELIVAGADNILNRVDEFGDLKAVQSLIHVIGEKHRLAELLSDEMTRTEKAPKSSRVRVQIGIESGLPELKEASLVTHVYRQGDRVLGVLGVIGSKQMDYARMIGLVEYVGSLVEARLAEWNKELRP